MIDPRAPWGWPWHGLITDGVVGDTGKIVTQPVHGYAWLIDMGLPAISRSAPQLAEDAAMGYEWRNYALIPAGRLYDTFLGANTFIHIDEDSVPWLVTLSFSFPGGDDFTVDYSIVRFGLFGSGAQTPVTGSETVTCADIALGTHPDTLDYYTRRETQMWDVATNGASVLVGIDLILEHLTVEYAHMCSLVEVSLSGSGGTDGSGLNVELAEIQPHSTLRWIADTGDADNGEEISTWARWAYYNAEGTACAAKLQTYDLIETIGSGPTVVVIQTMSLRLLENTTIMDELECYRYYDGSLGYAVSTWSGSLASHFASDDAWRPGQGSAYRIINAFTALNKWEATATGDTNLQPESVGYQRIDAHAHALYYSGTTRDYNTLVTPAGTVSGPPASTGKIYFAWQRKTGETSYANEPICYV